MCSSARAGDISAVLGLGGDPGGVVDSTASDIIVERGLAPSEHGFPTGAFPRSSGIASSSSLSRSGAGVRR
jgi:hypothetical protein